MGFSSSAAVKPEGREQAGGGRVSGVAGELSSPTGPEKQEGEHLSPVLIAPPQPQRV